ncbi:regulator of G-protein signaling 9-binding protein-like isoform X2 [Artemia franciscana]|uniref:regulator of G-protein signaling 9-binding protein-like isoform X2 n=1 Tax=Artemia franciscana TaxID=6661 RepID=UPI0032D9DA85
MRKVLLRELNREVSSCHLLALTLGGSGDCEKLRQELKRCRRKAQELGKATKGKLQNCNCSKLSEMNKKEVARLWCLLYCCFHVLATEMRRILLLQQRFALYKPSSNLINTGLPEYESSLRIFPYLNHTDVSIGDKMLLDWTERGQLQREIHEIECTMVDVKALADSSGADIVDYHHGLLDLEDDAEGCGSYQGGDSETSSFVEDSSMTPQHRQCVCGVMVVAISVFVLAAVLGVCIAFISG